MMIAATLCFLISIIISICANKEMGWIYTATIIAVMKNMFLVLDWTTMKLPR